MARKDNSAYGGSESPELNNPFAELQIDNLPLGEPVKSTPAKPKPSLGRVVLRREKAHRGGKVVTVVYDFAPSIGAQRIEDLARKLRNACGCGGTTKERTIEIQGDQVAKVRSFLEKEGFRVAGVT